MRYKNNTGFTLIELLVASVIIGIISVVSTQFLFDTITVRSKQYSISDSSDNARLIFDKIANSVQEANNVSVPDSSTLEITGDVCRTVRYNATNKKIEEAVDSSASCSPPSTGFSDMVGVNTQIDSFTVSPAGPAVEIVNISLQGINKGTLDEHPFLYQTTVTARVGI